MTPTLRPAAPDDIPDICALLEAVELPTAELEQHLHNFVVAEADGRVVGCGGLEACPEASACLIRSMVVDEALRGQDIGTAVLHWVMARAASLSLTHLLLFTVHAHDFYARFGFEDAALADFPEPMRRSAQYRAVSRFGREWGVKAMKKMTQPR